MSSLQKFLQFSVYSNLFIGACALALTCETFALLQLPITSNWYLLLIFLCTVFIYALHYYVKQFKEKTDDRLEWCRRNRSWLLFIVIFSLVLIAGGVLYHYSSIFGKPGHFNYRNLFWFIIIPLIALAYSYPLTPWNKKSLRQIGWLKMISLSFIWSFTTVALPVLMATGNEISLAGGPNGLSEGVLWDLWSNQLTVLFVHRFFFIAALSLLFNINDYEEDKNDGIKTIAVVWGPAKSLNQGKWLMALTNITSSIFLLQIFPSRGPLFIIAVFVPVVLLFLLYHRFKANRDEAAFVIRHDGLMIVKALLLIFAVLSFRL